MNDSFIFYDSFLTALDELDPVSQLKLYQAITRFAIRGEETELTGIEKAIFALIKPQLLANEQKREQHLKNVENGKKGASYGKLGGRPTKNEKQKTPLKTPPGFSNETPPQNPINVNANENVNVNVNENVNVNVECEAKAPTPHKNFSISNLNLSEWYGEYANVHLTKRQYDLLLSEVLDKTKLDELIGELSENIACNNGKAPPYDDTKPDMHFANLRKYWRYRKQNGFKPHATKEDKALALKRELDEISAKYRVNEVNSG